MPECWCKQPGLRYFRWVLPLRHQAVPPHWKQRWSRPIRAKHSLPVTRSARIQQKQDESRREVSGND